MFAVSNPEVLARDWLPPTALGREREVQEVVRRLDPPRPQATPPWIVAIEGPDGSGTSTIARRAAREVADRLRADGAAVSRSFAVRTSLLRGSHGVASTLLRRFDEGFDGRGFPTAEILAGFLRRLRRDGHPVVLILDDVAVGGPSLTPVLEALGNPDRFLPEGESGLPAVWTILAGSPEGLATAVRGLSARVPVRPFVRVAGLSEPELRAIVTDRAERALGRPPPTAVVDRLLARSVADGGGARRAMELLRRELVGRSLRGGAPWSVVEERTEVAIEPRVVRAISAATAGVSAGLGEVRRVEAELARSQGMRPLPTTTLWRRIVRLERAGILRREIRTGGAGGTRSVVRLLTPIDDWVTGPVRPGSPPAAGPVGVPAPPVRSSLPARPPGPAFVPGG